MSAQHLRPLFAFVVVAILGAVVFANSFRAQDVVDVIRGGGSNVLIGTPLLHEPLYVVEEGQRLDAAEAPEPEVAPSAPAAPEGGAVDGGASSADVSAPLPTPAAGSDAGTGSTGNAAPGGDGGQAPVQPAGDPPGAPKAEGTSPGHGQANNPGQAASNGPGSSAVGHEASENGNGHHWAKGHVHARAHDADGGDDRGRHEARGHEKNGHDKSDHGERGHAKTKDHAKAKGHAKAQGHAKAKGHAKHHGHR